MHPRRGEYRFCGLACGAPLPFSCRVGWKEPALRKAETRLDCRFSRFSRGDEFLGVVLVAAGLVSVMMGQSGGFVPRPAPLPERTCVPKKAQPRKGTRAVKIASGNCSPANRSKAGLDGPARWEEKFCVPFSSV